MRVYSLLSRNESHPNSFNRRQTYNNLIWHVLMFGSKDYVIMVCFGPVTFTVQFHSAIMIESIFFFCSFNDIFTFSVDRCFYHTASITCGTVPYRLCHRPYLRLSISPSQHPLLHLCFFCKQSYICSQ